jgi:penicillin-binding protein-related factor A (putative recombinase)
MAVNRGKQFENAVRTALIKERACSVDRFADPTAGYAGIKNVCDFVAYRQPNQFYFECKTTNGNTLPLSNISTNQWEGLLLKSTIPGVIAGYLIWFIKHDVTVFISATEMKRHAESGHKSVNVQDILAKRIDSLLVPGKKKRVIYEYDAVSFLNELQRS